MLRYGHLPLIGLAILLLGSAIFTAIADRTVALKLVQEAQTAQAQGRFADAERLADEALKYASKQYGEQSARVAEVHELRGHIYADEQKNQMAEEEYIKARMMRATLDNEGLNSPEYGHMCEVLGIFYTDRGKLMEAESCLQSALTIARANRGKPKKNQEDVIGNMMEAMRGPQDPDEARIMSELGWVYSKQGNYEKSEKLYKDAMSIREKVLAAGHPALRQNAEDLKLLNSLQRKF